MTAWKAWLACGGPARRTGSRVDTGAHTSRTLASDVLKTHTSSSHTAPQNKTKMLTEQPSAAFYSPQNKTNVLEQLRRYPTGRRVHLCTFRLLALAPQSQGCSFWSFCRLGLHSCLDLWNTLTSPHPNSPCCFCLPHIQTSGRSTCLGYLP